MGEFFLGVRGRLFVQACLYCACVVGVAASSSTKALAQRLTWKVTQPSSAARAQSIGIAGLEPELKFSFAEGISLVRTTEEKGEEGKTLTAIDLSTGRTLGRSREPDGWNWETTVVGERFACSTSINEIMVLELSSGEIVARSQVRTPGALSILFDKALWMAPGNWYVLPALVPVQKHSIVDPAAASRLIYGLGSTKPWMLSPDEAVVHGVVYGTDLRPTSRFFGHFTDTQSPGNDTMTFSGYLRNRKAFDGTEMQALKFSGLQRIGAEHHEIEIVSPSNLELKPGKVKLAAFREGICGLIDGHLLVVVFKKEQQVLLLGDVLTCPPPLIAWEGEPYKGPVGRASEREIKGLGLSQSEFDFDVAFDTAAQSISIGLKNGETLKFANHKNRRMEIARNVWRMSLIGLDSPWEEVVAAYKANNMNWLAPYASGVSRGFKGIPVELPVEVKIQYQQPFSVVVDFPESALQEGYAALQTEKSKAVKHDTEELFSALLKRDKLTELPQNEALPPAVKAPFPENPDLDALRGAWILDVDTIFQACVVPVPIIVRWLVLMGVIAYFNSGTSGPHDAIILAGGKLIGALLLSAAWIFLSTGFVFVLDAARAEWLGESAWVVFVVGTLNLVVDIAIVFLLMPFASRRGLGEIAPVAATVVGILIGFIVSLFVLAFVMGAIAGMLKP